MGLLQAVLGRDRPPQLHGGEGSEEAVAQGQVLGPLPQPLLLRLIVTLQPGAQQLLCSEVTPETLNVVGVPLSIAFRPGASCDVFPCLLRPHRHIRLQDDEFLTVAGGDLHVQVIQLPVHQLSCDDDL